MVDGFFHPSIEHTKQYRRAGDDYSATGDRFTTLAISFLLTVENLPGCRKGV